MQDDCDRVISALAGSFWTIKNVQRIFVSYMLLVMFPLRPLWHISPFVLGKNFKFHQEMMFFDFARDTNWTPLNFTPHWYHRDNC